MRLLRGCFHNADPVRKVSIVARGMMGGYTRVVPDEDRLFKTKGQFEDELAVFMAGHVAESLVFEEQSTGAANDIERATMLARRMVTEFGMSRDTGSASVRQEGRTGFPGPRDQRAAQLQRRSGLPDRSGDSQLIDVAMSAQGSR